MNSFIILKIYKIYLREYFEFDEKLIKTLNFIRYIYRNNENNYINAQNVRHFDTTTNHK
jgi:hypothetical protein